MSNKGCSVNIRGKQVCYIHIPKTGGQSIQAALGMGLRKHLPVREPIRSLEIGRGDLSFAFVRNPYHRAVSLFYWLAELHLSPKKRMPENAALNQWCRNTDLNTFWKNVDVEYINKQTSANMFRQQSWFLSRRDGSLHPKVRILKFESMDEGWAEICRELGVAIHLPKKNSSRSQGRDELDSDSRKRIASIYFKDFENFYPQQDESKKYM